MINSIRKLGIIAISALFLLSVANAQEAATIETPKQIQLTPDMVKRYVAAWGELRTWQKAHEPTSKIEDEEEAEENSEDYKNTATLAQLVKSSPEVKAILTKNNFDSVEKFNEVAQSVMSAYQYIDPESGLGPGYEENVRKSIEQVKNSKEYSEAEKAEAVKGLESDLLTAQKSKPLPGNVDIVKPYAAEIKKIEESE